MAPTQRRLAILISALPTEPTLPNLISQRPATQRESQTRLYIADMQLLDRIMFHFRNTP